MTISYSDIVKKIKEAAKEAASTPNHPEAKLRERVAPIWDDYIRSKRINLNFSPRDERQLANGRADTVFNRLILEYKKPGSIHPNNEKNRKLIGQVQGYIQDLAEEERWKEERLLGVVFDGKYFLYIQKKHGRWIPEEPESVSEKSLEKFFLYLEKLTGKAALVPENLIKDFAVGAGSLNYVASNTIKAFYFALTKNVDPKVEAFFKQWANQFAEVHGAIENKKFNAETLFKSYGFKKDEQKNFNFLAFFFALDTYYGLLMKLLAYQVVGFYTLKNVAGLPLSDWEKLDSAVLKEKLAELEEGGIFRSLGIRNFLEGDLLSWYLNDWNDAIEKAIRGIIERLNQYDPETMELVPDETRDILKKLYQFLVPKQIRHDLGEYYTPDWLAERCLNQVGYGVKKRDLLQKRVLDPGCGSGTFLILAIKRAKEHARLKNIDPADTLTQITKNIVGFDLNPLAVISARTNYLLAIADLLKHKKGELTIPIYLCDSINPPSAKHQDELFDQEAGHYQISTSVGLFRFPEALVQKALIQKVTVLLEDCVKKKLSTEQFLERVHAELKTEPKDIPPKADAPPAHKKFDLVLGETYEKLVDLEAKGINGIWARIIKNAFAPLFVGQFDYVVGNPPWVNWESLPQEYRDKTVDIWQRYDLFEHTGLRARLGSAKDDISVLMTYVAIEKYLRDKGRLCIVITQTLFKTVGGGEGFRRFRLGKKGTPFKVFQVDDMTELQPFDSATNRTAVFFCQKGEPTSYPVEYHIWKKREKGSIDIDLNWNEIQAITTVMRFKAQPVDDSVQGAWISFRPRTFKTLQKVIGESSYRARAGICGWFNSIYFVKVVGKKNDRLIIQNFQERAKKEVKAVQCEIEADLVFPLIRGRDIQKWGNNVEVHHLIAHNPKDPKHAIDLASLEKRFPLAFSYFEGFKRELLSRNGYRKYLEPAGEPYYALYNIGSYTFSPFKVCWLRISDDLKACVVSSNVVPENSVTFVSFEHQLEAHYFCSLFLSSVARYVITISSVAGTGTWGSPHVLDKLGIKKYDPTNDTHKELARLSKQCHEKVAAGISVTDLEEQIDELAAELWGLTKEELKDIKESLEEMR